MNKKVNHAKIILTFGFLWLLASPVSLLHAMKYSITELGSEGTQSSAWAINDRGQIVVYQDSTILLYEKGSTINISELYNLPSGYYGPSGFAINYMGQIVTNDSDGNAILLSRMTINNLNTLNAPFSMATGINNSGQIVGTYQGNDYFTHAFLYEKGQMKDIEIGWGSGSSAINELGMIVGWYSSTGFYRPFLYINGVTVDITPFDSHQSFANDINNQGQVVGEFLTADGSATHAFIYNNGMATDLGVLDGSYSSANALNERGEVVGSSTVLAGTEIYCVSDDYCHEYPQYSYHAFIYRQGVMTDLNKLIPKNSGWELKWAYDINNRGQIVGVGFYNGEQRGFLLTPTAVSKQSTLRSRGVK